MRKATFQGEVCLYNANIGGNFECSGGTFTGSEDGALDASLAKIGSNVYLNASFKAKEKIAVTFKGAIIGGDLSCSGGTFTCNNGEALNAAAAQIQGGLFFSDGVQADGSVVFKSAHINGEFDLVGVSSVESLNLDMQFAKVGILRNDKRSWPLERKLSLEGFAYDEIDHLASPTAQTQIEWLHHQPQDQFLSQPYEQLAGTFRNMGQALRFCA